MKKSILKRTVFGVFLVLLAVIAFSTPVTATTDTLPAPLAMPSEEVNEGEVGKITICACPWGCKHCVWCWTGERNCYCKRHHANEEAGIDMTCAIDDLEFSAEKIEIPNTDGGVLSSMDKEDIAKFIDSIYDSPLTIPKNCRL